MLHANLPCNPFIVIQAKDSLTYGHNCLNTISAASEHIIPPNQRPDQPASYNETVLYTLDSKASGSSPHPILDVIEAARMFVTWVNK